MLLNEQLTEISQFYDGELALPAGPGSGSLNERTPDAVLAHVKDVARSPVAIIGLGSICFNGNDGNAVKFQDSETLALARDFYYDAETGEAVNSIGLKQPGIEQMEPIITEAAKIAADHGKVLKVSVSSFGDEDASQVVPKLVERVLEAGAHGAEINLGCPNKVELGGHRHPIIGLDPEATEAVLMATIDRVGIDQMIGPKLSWYERQELDDPVEYARLKKVLTVVRGIKGMDFVTLSNTEPNVVMKFGDGSYVLDKISGNAGGGSGPARKEKAYQQLVVARQELPDEVDVITANGVFDGAEVWRRQQAGAALSEMVTRPWVDREEGISFGDSFKRVYREYLEAREQAVA